jgi:hypothetical protein
MSQQNTDGERDIKGPYQYAFEKMSDGLFGDKKPAPAMKINADKTVAVATDYFWNENMGECPRGVKCQLLGRGGVAIYGQYNGVDPFWVGWAPLPKRRHAL